jgi:hypothetical protein
LLVGVLALKNAVQLAAIAFSAPELLVVPGALDELAGADEVAGADELAGGVELDEAPGLLLPQAAAPRPRVHARMIRSDLLVTIASNLQLLTARGAHG